MVFAATVIFCYTATLITLPQETAVLLPEDTNWGRVNEAVNSVDVNEDDFGLMLC